MIGDFLGAALQSFTHVKQQQQQQEELKKEKDARLKLFEIQLQREQRANAEAEKQSKARDQFFGKLQPPMDQVIDRINDPSLPPLKRPSLVELLADPENAALAMQGGVVEPSALLQQPKVPDSIALLQALKNDPALAEVDAARRRAGASQVNVGDQGMTKPPTGFFRPDPRSPGLQVEPGGPVERERALDLAGATNSLKGSQQSLNSLAQEALAIRNDPNLWRITGVAGTLPNMPGGGAADLEARLQTLTSKVAFGTLQSMRDASKTGGALGSVSEKELKLLESSLAALDKRQSSAAYQKSLDRIIEFATESQKRMQKAFDDTYMAKGKKVSFSELPD